MEHDDDDEDDGFAPIQAPLDQPAQYVQPHEHTAARGAYMDAYFIPPFDDEDLD